jgi:hypothetical protein
MFAFVELKKIGATFGASSSVGNPGHYVSVGIFLIPDYFRANIAIPGAASYRLPIRWIP